MISEKTIEDTVYQLYKKAAIDLNEDVVKSLEDALENEEDELAKLNISNILKNIELAHKNQIPMCQDTGLGVIFVKLGNVEVENLKEGIEKGVRKATKEVPLRPNIVDPITRENSGDNTGVYIPYISIELTDTDYLEITVLPKGFGSENNNKLKMALPAEGKEGIKDFVIESVLAAGGKPCPPMVVGVGIGGDFEKCAELAKEALIREKIDYNRASWIDDLEIEMKEAINNLGIGPAGLGGRNTALAVNVNTYPTHIAGLPVAVNICCHVNRHSHRVI